MKKIVLCHQYHEKSHYQALYTYAEKWGYEIIDFVVLDKKYIIRQVARDIIYNHNIFPALKRLIDDLVKIHKLKKTKDKILIVGLAPYDYLMNEYVDVFRNNKSYYFTSWQCWDGTYFLRGNEKNKEYFEDIINSAFKGVACVSENTEEQIRKYNCNTTVVKHSVNTNEYKKKKSSDKNSHKYVYLGQLIERKNIDYILRWISESNYNFEFYFAGSGFLENKIVNVASYDKRVHFLGRLSKHEIKETLCSYDFLVLPSKEEIFGIVLIEALAAGVPCIVSNAFGPNEIISDSMLGFKFDLLNGYDGFKNIMDASMKVTSEQYSSMIEKCLCAGEKYDSAVCVKRWIDLIER